MINFVAKACTRNIAAYSDNGIKWKETTMPSAASWINRRLVHFFSVS